MDWSGTSLTACGPTSGRSTEPAPHSSPPSTQETTLKSHLEVQFKSILQESTLKSQLELQFKNILHESTLKSHLELQFKSIFQESTLKSHLELQLNSILHESTLKSHLELQFKSILHESKLKSHIEVQWNLLDFNLKKFSPRKLNLDLKLTLFLSHFFLSPYTLFYFTYSLLSPFPLYRLHLL